MGAKLRQVLFKKHVKYLDVSEQCREPVGKEAVKPSHFWFCNLMLGQQPAEEPKRLFFTAAAYHQDKAGDEVHRLAIAYVFVVDRIGLQDVSESFLTNSPVLRDGEKRVGRKRPIQVLVNNVQPLVVLTLLELILIQAFALAEDT